MIRLRIVRQTYVVCAERILGNDPVYEEKFVCSTVIREFEYDEDPYAVTAEEIGMSDEFYPSGYDAKGKVRNGDHIYTYILVTETGKFIRRLFPYSEDTDDPFERWLPDDIFSLSHDDDI